MIKWDWLWTILLQHAMLPRPEKAVAGLNSVEPTSMGSTSHCRIVHSGPIIAMAHGLLSLSPLPQWCAPRERHLHMSPSTRLEKRRLECEWHSRVQEALGVSVRVDLELVISTIHIWDEVGCFFHICLGKFNVYHTYLSTLGLKQKQV